MRLAISGTYSSGKTLTVMALAHYTGMPRTLARSIREILPEAVPGKRLAECTWAEFLQLMVRRHTERVVAEAMLPDGYLSDGSSLQEWVFGKARVLYGTMDPASIVGNAVETPSSEQMRYFDEALDQFGHGFKQHVSGSFDAFVHLRHELPLAADGHRPMNEDFRTSCDDLMLQALAEMGIPYYIVEGTITERISTIVSRFDLSTVCSPEEAIALAQRDHAELDMRYETERVTDTGSLSGVPAGTAS